MAAHKERSLLAYFGIGGDGGHASPAPDPNLEVQPEAPAAPNDTDDTKIAERVRQGERALVKSAAMELAAAEGVKPKRAGAFVSLVDLSGVRLDGDDPDEDAIRVALRRTLEHYPELKARTSTYGRAPGGGKYLK
jgi:hypothetical protein